MNRRHIVFMYRRRWPSGAAAPPAPPPGSLYLDTVRGSVATPAPLVAGRRYTVTVTGTVSDWNMPLTVGRPEPDAMFPTQHEARSSVQVGIDAAVLFAHPEAHPQTLGPWKQFQVDLHDGRGWQTLTPLGGPFQTPQPGHTYRYTLTGQGQVATFGWRDTPAADNYGMLRIDVTEQQAT